jgi:hypothetical protein
VASEPQPRDVPGSDQAMQADGVTWNLDFELAYHRQP